MTKCLMSCLLVLTLSSCKTFILDTSMSAAQAGDPTIVSSIDNGIPSLGFQVVRANDNTPITQVWSIIVPFKKNVVSGEMTIKYKDKKLSLPITDSKVDVPFSRIIGEGKWARGMDGVALVTIQLQFKTPTNDANFVDLLGFAFIRILPPNYNPLPIGSPLGVWEADCHVEYSTNGRSALECLP